MFSDRLDVSYKESLYEYGIIRNPETNKTILCINAGQEHNKKNPPQIRSTYITLEEVKEALEEAPSGYWSYIGGWKVNELQMLNNENLSHHIFSLWHYNGSLVDHVIYY